MKRFFKGICLILAVVMLLSVTACGEGKQAALNGKGVLNYVLKNVQFAEEMKYAGERSALYFTELPEGAEVIFYNTGSGYFADEAALITVKATGDMAAVKASVETHLTQLENQFANYIPEEVYKVENAVTWDDGLSLVLCVTDDYKNAQNLLKNPDDSDPALPGTEKQEPVSSSEPEVSSEPEASSEPEVSSEPEASSEPEVSSQPEEAEPESYPVLQSEAGYSRELTGAIMAVDNHAFEYYGFVEDSASYYAELVNKTADALKGETTVYSMPIPTAIGVVLPDDVHESEYPSVKQGEDIEFVISQFSENVVPVRCFDNLMRHRDEYLYFRTDHHWNGPGAYYAYEAFCETKGIAPYTMDQREEMQFDGFLGTLYELSEGPDSILPADTVFAYKPYCQDVTMEFFNNDGVGTQWDVISDATEWGSGSKYYTFAGADNPLTVFTNPQVTDGSVCIVVKESYGNALMSYIADHYSTVYEIDYRYWEGDLVSYAKEVGADDMIFANNLMMISANVLVGMLSSVIPE